MSEYLFNIADSFEIDEQVLILASDRKIHQIPQLVKVGQLFEFRPVGAPIFHARVTSIQKIYPFSPYKPLGFSVESSVHREHVPIGTEVWLMSDVAT